MTKSVLPRVALLVLCAAQAAVCQAGGAQFA